MPHESLFYDSLLKGIPKFFIYCLLKKNMRLREVKYTVQ